MVLCPAAPTLIPSEPNPAARPRALCVDGRGRRHGGLGRTAVREAQVAQGGREERRGLGGLRVGVLHRVDGHDTVVPPLRDAGGTGEFVLACRVLCLYCAEWLLPDKTPRKKRIISSTVSRGGPREERETLSVFSFVLISSPVRKSEPTRRPNADRLGAIRRTSPPIHGCSGRPRKHVRRRFG